MGCVTYVRGGCILCRIWLLPSVLYKLEGIFVEIAPKFWYNAPKFHKNALKFTGYIGNQIVNAF